MDNDNQTPQPETKTGGPAEPLESPPAQNSAPPAGSKGSRNLILGIIAALILVGGLVFLFLSPSSPLSRAKVPTGPKLLAGQNPYLYACSLVDAEAVGKTLKLSTDKNKMAVEETYDYAPADTQHDQLDVIKLVGAKDKEDQKATSVCTIKFDRTLAPDESGDSVPVFKEVTVTADQFASASAAQEVFKANRPSDAKPLSGFGDKGYFTPPAVLSQNSSAMYVTAAFTDKNVIFTLDAPSKDGDSSGTTVASQLAPIGKGLSERVAQGEGTRPKNFSGGNKVGDNPLLDACLSIDYVKVAAGLGGNSEFRVTGVLADKVLAPDDFNGTRPKSIESSCGFSFRTQEDADALAKAEKTAKSQAPPPLPGGDEPISQEGANTAAIAGMTYGDKFPHLLDVRYVTTASSSDAQQMVKKVKEDVQKASSGGQQKYQIQDTTLGDGGIRIAAESQHQTGQQGEGTPTYYDTTIYYTAKGPYVYMVTAFFTRQDNPYHTTSHKLTDEGMKSISQAIEAGIKHAEKQAK
jgi:hypothetical protein